MTTNRLRSAPADASWTARKVPLHMSTEASWQGLRHPLVGRYLSHSQGVPYELLFGSRIGGAIVSKLFCQPLLKGSVLLRNAAVGQKTITESNTQPSHN